MSQIEVLEPADRSSRFRGFSVLIGGLLAVLGLLAAPPRADAAFPGDNGDIVYQRFYRGGSEIFSYDPEARTSQRLTSNKIKSGSDIAAGAPAFSANGSKIVFTNAVKRRRTSGRRNNLFVMKADGSRPRRLTRSDAHQSDPGFSPDSSLIAFGEAGDVHVIGVDASGETNLTAGLPGGGAQAVFSPDGTKIALTTSEAGDSDIYLINVDGSDPVNLTAGSADDEYQPAFSPDGSRVAFVSDRLDFHGDLFVMDVDGSDAQAVTSNPGIEHYDPAFSPDGSKLVYTSRLNASSAVDVFTIAIEGGAATRPTGLSGVAQNPDWGVAAP